MKILVVEDEPSLQEVIRNTLEKERYIVEVADNLNGAIEKTGVYDYDCILLDIMLPDGSGLELLQHLKQNRKKENVIIISAKDSIDDKIAGLDLGADDYLAKPFHLAELVARVRSVLRRKHRDGEHTISVGTVTLFPDNFMVQVAGNPLDLSRKEYDILHHFINRKGRLVSKSALAEAVWGDYIDQADNYDFIYAQMKNLRKKLADAGADIEIKAVYGAGYKLVE
ncbi:MAG: response regulator transcription factor [Bacteroidales bacterium]|nr:response regulator transcription factor [Bacteroidales bacterium]